MSWKQYTHAQPEQSGAYLISVSRKTNEDVEFVFNYVAYYDSGTNQWYKYDPFQNKKDSAIQEQINDNIIAWKSEPVFLGHFK